MGHEEELKKEFERDCAKEWNKRRLAREYATPQGEAHWSEGLGICGPRDYKLDSCTMEPKSSRATEKAEGNMGFEETSLPDKHDYTLADLYTSPCQNFIPLTLAFLRSMRDAGT